MPIPLDQPPLAGPVYSLVYVSIRLLTLQLNIVLRTDFNKSRNSLHKTGHTETHLTSVLFGKMTNEERTLCVKGLMNVSNR